MWAGDITYIPTKKGWLYLAVVIDLYSRKVIGWSLQAHMRASLVLKALEQALQTRRPNSQTIFHSDRGSQYASRAFRQRLERAGLRQSMSARANPYDNANTESFIGALKREMLGPVPLEGIKEAGLAIFEYIDAYYSPQRRHSALGYLSPSQFERQHRCENK